MKHPILAALWVTGWLMVFFVGSQPIVSGEWGGTGSEVLDQIVFVLFVIVPLLLGGVPLAYIMIKDYAQDRRSSVGRGYAIRDSNNSDRRCAWCAGTGHYVVDGHRGSCLACGGARRVPVSEPIERCRQCGEQEVSFTAGESIDAEAVTGQAGNNPLHPDHDRRGYGFS